MAFTDEIKIHIKAGDGGDGVVRWLHEKGKEFMGPAGGNGGRGGDVYIVGRRDVHLLAKYKAEKNIDGVRGEDGRGRSEYGADGKDTDIELPVGSVVTNLETGQKFSLFEDGERILILKGGYGGRGNEYFKKSTNTTPKESTPGGPGERADFHIEVELIADIGLIGLPNAGKTSLLNELTRSQGKVGAYPFTTLEPALGEMHGVILADIPGLIEGASDGKGLGHKFLKHIRRTKVLAHLVSLENEDPLATYETVRKELGQFDPELLNKKELVILTKTDIVGNKLNLDQTLAKFKERRIEALALTIYDDDALKTLREKLREML